MDTKYTHHIHPYAPFPYAHPPPIGICPRKIPILPVCPSFLKVFIDSPRGFHLGTSGLHASCFNQINSCYLLILYNHAPLMFNSFQYSKLYYSHIQMVCFNIFHSITFFSSITSCSLRPCYPKYARYLLSHYYYLIERLIRN
jgi:hypothetical protein